MSEERYLDDCIFIPQEAESAKLHHYTNAVGLMGICAKQFWVTDSHFLNDPSEFCVGTEVFLELVRKKIPESEERELFCEAVVADIEENEAYPGTLSSGYYVLSFCLTKDSALMWSEFSDFAGYCMTFGFGGLMDALAFEPNWHGRVVYDHDEQIKLMERSFEGHFFDGSVYEYLTGWDSFVNCSEDQLQKLATFAGVVCSVYNMFFKKQCFSGEDEYRFIFSCFHKPIRHKDEVVPLHFRERNGVLIPYVEIGLSELHCLESVIIGPKNQIDLAQIGLEAFFKNQGIEPMISRSGIPLRY